MFKTQLIDLTSRAMDASALRNSVISNNIANVNTPGFKKSDVSFKTALDESLSGKIELKKTKRAHMTGDFYRNENDIIVYQIKNTKIRTDGNNVDIDMELSKLAENSLRFNSLTNFLSKQLDLLRNSINGGSR